MKVKEMMHKGVEWVSPDTPVATLAKKMLQYDVGALPIGENDRLIGMVTDRDIAMRGVAKGKDISKLTAKDIMTKNVIWCRDSESMDDAARIMEKNGFGGCPSLTTTREWSVCSALVTFHTRHRNDFPPR